MTGADWIWSLAALCESRGLSIYLLGSEPGIAAEAGERLKRWYPRLRVAGTHHGFFEIGSPHAERVVEDINARRPDILLAGMGTPKQEQWVTEHADRVDAGVLWTVGALFDYVSGRIPRAPGWLADNGLEWIFRLGIEPQRMWRRYLLGNPMFLSRVLHQSREA
jgi:N-acetylglucosaminyldiphosphoundecaprenol N-acetyl-beta-D-mannosaminyltransferase